MNTIKQKKNSHKNKTFNEFTTEMKSHAECLELGFVTLYTLKLNDISAFD